ncbi:MAG: hypothetical protein B7Z55_06440 [Planctomycetales bacterium 12-60-4]|nr:MAG: hypothetical protein B7Z55_06440 [Planctomycetales bacterium 12-60-4]
MKPQHDDIESLALVDSNRAFGTDEMNLCEFPLAACGHRTNPEQKTLIFTDEIFDEGNQQAVQRKLVVSASDAFGLPTPVDSDVLLVLMHLTNCRTRFQSPTVHFTRYELVKFLGWDNSGKSYKRLEESLQRWASVTLFYNHAWWDRDRKRWRSQTFHVLESLDLRGREGRGAANDDGQSSFTWSKVIFSSFQSNHLKRLDLGTYFRLHNPASRQAYRFLDKRFYRSARFEMDLRVFACEHVGLARSYDNAQLKRKLTPALEELEAIGFLVPESATNRFVRRVHGEWQIVLHRQNQGTAVPLSDEASTPLAVELTTRGLRATIAAELVRTFPAQQIAEKIELHDWLIERNDKRISQNAAGFLATAIREDYKLPKGFISKAERDKRRELAAQQEQAAALARQEQSEQSATRQAAISYWEALPADERAALESAAIAAGSSELVERHKQLGSTMFAGMLLKEIVINYLRNSEFLKTTGPVAAAAAKS